MIPSTCPTCGTPVQVEGKTTKYYVPIGEARLRELDAMLVATSEHADHWQERAEKAESENERLRAHGMRLEDHRTIMALESENERLREALDMIGKGRWNRGRLDYRPASDFAREVLRFTKEES